VFWIGVRFCSIRHSPGSGMWMSGACGTLNLQRLFYTHVMEHLPQCHARGILSCIV
jgi:hypothetical protein